MKRIENTALLVLGLMFTVLMASGQVNVKDACRLEDERLVFRIDLQWSRSQKAELMRLFEIDSAVLEGVYAGKSEMVSRGITWKVKKVTPRIVELSKPLTAISVLSADPGDVVLVDDDLAGYSMEAAREASPYGVNKFTRFSVFQYINGYAHFFLPGHLSVKQVVLSGTFNGWSTTQMPMVRSDSGWTLRMKLKPGRYLYKYILDGNWTSDPFNRLWGRDGNINDNSVVYCYNYFFTLKGKTNARTVYLAGSFNRWNTHELKMFKTAYGWALPLYLREGTHAYKFIVDGEWITDPNNPVKRPDGSGNYNSFLGIGTPFNFTLNGYPNARKVMVAGNFNGWNPRELQMEKAPGGWQLNYVLAPGNYEYKFIVDGKWMTDPDNPFKVGKGDYQNSVLVVQPNHIFVLKTYLSARNVIVTGSFNQWNADGWRMTKKDGQWILPVHLNPGKYTYKFVVDGKWIMDPMNDLWEDNEYGTGNSVVWIEP